MRKPLLALAACVAVLTAAPAVAAQTPVAAELTDECGLVRVTYPAGVTGSFTVTRDGEDVTAVPSPLPEGGNFAIVAQAGQAISLAGSVSGSHTHATPAGCDEPKVSVVSFEDRCQDHSAVTFRNSGTVPATGYQIVGRGVSTQIPALPPGDSTHVAQHAFTINWTSPHGAVGTLANHGYVTPDGCGPSTLQHAFADRCGRIEWTVTNNARGAQRVILAKGTEAIRSDWVPVGGPHTYSIPVTEGDTIRANYAHASVPPLGEHTYAAPASCAAGGLPITGSKTQSLAWLGVALVIAGIGVFAFARRRTMG
ncbi:LPXTG cell wall anchor domain-containing protein [Allorhizocola rhizosphaerae]|uniref:LPXTG cell wall anchor domain-containing protein n=1 Tax=Allorhizocola rhizosphaerae TaxID=1872709 RepID=UPI000E3C8A75|nr:LPXTG cell wall anchor domain-containing protein [Allorhizocola rhizosphaerae]